MMNCPFSLFCILLNFQILLFVNSEWIIVTFHHYSNLNHTYLNSGYTIGNSSFCCNTTYCMSCDDCKMNCDTFLKVYFNESTLISETCYNTTEPTGDNTTIIPFTTSNRVQFYTNLLCEVDSLLTIEVKKTLNNTLYIYDNYSIAINKRSPDKAIYNGSYGNSQLNLSIIFSCHAIDCTEKDNEYGHYVCDCYGNKTCKNGYTSPEKYCTTKIDSCNSSTTPTPVDPSVNYQDNDVWKPVAIVSLVFCFLLMLCLIILIIVFCSCILKIKRNDDRVDVGNSSGVNNLIYAQPIISTKDSYVLSKIENKSADTYNTLFDSSPPMSTANAEYSILSGDNM